MSYKARQVIDRALRGPGEFSALIGHPTPEQEWAVGLLAASGDAYAFDRAKFPPLDEPSVFAFGPSGQPVRAINVNALRAQTHLTYGDIARAIQDAWNGVIPPGVPS